MHATFEIAKNRCWVYAEPDPPSLDADEWGWYFLLDDFYGECVTPPVLPQGREG